MKNWAQIQMLVNRCKAPYSVIHLPNSSGWLMDLKTGVIVAVSIEDAERIIKSGEAQTA